MRINQNVMAFNASRNLSSTNVQLGKSLEKLSSGFRINRAADDAAGLVISQGLRAQIGGLQQATRNAQDGISVVQTAEGALNEIHTMLNRMRELAVQAANTGANDGNAREAAQTELSQLRTEVNRIADSTQFGGVSLLKGTYGSTASTAELTFTGGTSFTVADDDGFSVSVGGTVYTGDFDGVHGANQSGSDIAAALQSKVRAALYDVGQDALAAGFSVESVATGDGFTLKMTSETADIGASSVTVAAHDTDPVNAGNLVEYSAGQGGVFQIGANEGDRERVSIANMLIEDGVVGGAMTKLGEVDLRVGADAEEAITTISNAINYVSEQRGNLGAVQNRFESMINNLSVTTENLQASESRIRDTDMAAEMVAFTRNQVLQQAGTAMLAQANQVPQTILQLLR